MGTLILKLGAAGDVVRTTTLLHLLDEDVSWLTADENAALLEGLSRPVEVLPWSRREAWKGRKFDLVINLEDTSSAAAFLAGPEHGQLFGARLDEDGGLVYSDDSAEWFDMSLISRFGKEEADRRKLANRRTYQEMLFAGLGARFRGEPYHLPAGKAAGLMGDVAIAPRAGSVWPIKNWAYFDGLVSELRAEGLTVNVLPQRDTLVDHLADVRGHACLVSGDSLPMHLALGSGVPPVTIFTCTSPWEIHGYGIQHKVVSPLLDRYFYRRDFDARATTCVSVGEVFGQVAGLLALKDAGTVPDRSPGAVDRVI